MGALEEELFLNDKLINDDKERGGGKIHLD